MVTWRCPSCQDPLLEASNEISLSWAIARHIRDHEDRAAVNAVLRAGSTCGMHGCRIGQLALKDATGLPYPTDFDKRFLSTMRISWN